MLLCELKLKEEWVNVYSSYDNVHGVPFTACQVWQLSMSIDQSW